MVVTIALLRHVGDVMHKKGWIRDVLPQVYDHLAVVVNASKLENLAMYSQSLQSNKPSQYLTAALRNEVRARAVEGSDLQQDTMNVSTDIVNLAATSLNQAIFFNNIKT